MSEQEQKMVMAEVLKEYRDLRATRAAIAVKLSAIAKGVVTSFNALGENFSNIHKDSFAKGMRELDIGRAPDLLDELQQIDLRLKELAKTLREYGVPVQE